uniref:5'-nucleotidase n=1 Tax=Chaetoceros debilis TaxID=122233 RepID=A0A7S3VBY2_9STRA
MMRMTFTTFTTGAFLLHLFLVSLFKDNASPFTFTFTSNDVSILQVVEAFAPCCNLGISNRPSYSLLLRANDVDTSSSGSSGGNDSTSSGTSSGPHLITFDLDDTIFPVGPVVHDANVALMEHLASLTASLTNANNANANAPTTTTTCITQSDFIASTKFIRSELAKDGIKITYTELRKRTIQREIERISLIGIEKSNNNDNDSSSSSTVVTISKEVVSDAYELWEEHRHMAAERHLYHDTIAMLDELKETFPDATIAAITNGKGNPLRMTNTIAKYFDYCISGEDDNVFPYRKPDAGIYKVAVEKYQQEYNTINTGSGSDSVSGSGSDTNTSSDDDDFCWIHIGDDLANDVGASAQCGAKSIWVDLDEELYNQTTHTGSGTTPGTTTTPSSGSTGTDNEKEKQQQQQQPVWSTATKEEQEMRRILNEEAQKYVAARVQNLSELPDVVKNISMGSVHVSCS